MTMAVIEDKARKTRELNNVKLTVEKNKITRVFLSFSNSLTIYLNRPHHKGAHWRYLSIAARPFG